MILKSCAKLNLYLEVLNKRKDAYHNIKTLFERIDLADKIILKSRPDRKIRIICNSNLIPKGNSNLAYRAARLLQERFNIKRGLDIKIIKNIPVGSGLGGGSSNAASVLMGLNKLWKLHLSQKKIVELGKRIGSDVPFFIYDCPFALGEARGDKITPIKAFQRIKFWHILVVPKIKVSTPYVYKKWDGFPAPIGRKKGRNQLVRGLTRPQYDVKILPLAIRKKDLSLMGEVLFNSLEQATTRLYPELINTKEKLMHLGLKTILMSGSGPAIFGMVSSRKEAASIYRQLKGFKSWQVFVTRTH